MLTRLLAVLSAAWVFPETEGRQGAKKVRQPCLAASALFGILLITPRCLSISCVLDKPQLSSGTLCPVPLQVLQK